MYAKTCDKGETRLAGGQQIWKDSVRVEAYGDVDELNSTIWVVRAFNTELLESHPSADRLEEELRSGCQRARPFAHAYADKTAN